MKSIRICSLTVLLTAMTSIAFAQNKTESFQVSGNCGMCKSRIEKAAKEAGATDAKWEAATQQLTITYSSTTTNAAKIQEKIAAVGHDNAGFKATMDVYNKLPGCCKYDKAATSDKMDCCKDGKCSNAGHCDKPCCKKEGDMKMDCCKDGKCNKEGHDGKDCCKKDGAAKMDCCKDGKCNKEGHDGKDCCKKDGAAKMDCCKDGKCSKEGHDGKDCCKKS